MADVNESTPMNEVSNADQTAKAAQTAQAAQVTETIDEAERLYLKGMQNLLGIGISQNVAQAKNCFEKAVALKEHAKAAYQLGLENLDQEHYDDAKKMLSIAAEHGHVFATCELCQLYCEGKIQVSRNQVIEWIKVLAEHKIQEAQYQLGKIYLTGVNGYIQQSYEEASEWFIKAAKQGHAEAQFLLGEMYYLGLGVIQSYDFALNYFTMAANQGHFKAKFRLGTMYCEGEGTEQDLAKAEQCYKSVSFQDPYKAHAKQQVEYIENIRNGTIVRALLKKQQK